MKTFTFRYDPHPRRSAIKSIEKSLRSGKAAIDQDSIACKSVEDMVKLMTKTRFQVFTAIVEQAPDSLTELAKILDKDLANIQRDVRVLESLGLVELEKLAARRGEKLKPRALYDRIVFECEPKRERKVG